MARCIAVCLLALALAGCAAWTLVGTERQRVADSYTVAPQVQWSRFKQGNAELWTVDGPALQALRFFEPIDDGDSLFSRAGDDKLPSYRAAMSETEIQEFIVHSFERAGAAQVETMGLRPWRAGALSGFRFEMSFLSNNGLEMLGTVAGAVHGQKLLLITYTGTRVHYFPRWQEVVDRVLASIQITS